MASGLDEMLSKAHLATAELLGQVCTILGAGALDDAADVAQQRMNDIAQMRAALIAAERYIRERESAGGTAIDASASPLVQIRLALMSGGSDA